MFDEPGMLQLHRSYSTTTGLFSAKRDADALVSRMRSMFGRRFTNFNPLAVSLEGKKNKYYISFPRIRDFWSPRDTTVRGIAQEIARIANEFATIYERKSPND